MKLSAKGEILFVVVEDPSGGFVANALSHGITTQAETMDELREMVREAVDCYFNDDGPARLSSLALIADAHFR